MGAKQSVRGLALEELRAWAKSHGLESFRGNQIFSAVHNQRTDNWGKITSLPKPLRAQLEGSFSIESLILEKKFISLDGTRRFLYRAEDGKVVETVFIPTPNRDTICFSSQAGCALGCSFCLTAKLGFLRNLTVAEIVDQIAITLREVYGVGSNLPHGTNLVAMGEGEPFHNYENLLKAIEIITDKAGMGIAHRRITVSTAGIVPKIRDFSKLSIRPRLAISLSAPNDELRNKLMPINKRWPIGELMKAAREFQATLKKGERFTFEYVMLEGVNDSLPLADELARLLKKHDLQKVKVNLIPHNPAAELDYHSSPLTLIRQFKNRLEERGISAYIRASRGRDIYAACGQLAAMTTPLQISG